MSKLKMKISETLCLNIYWLIVNIFSRKFCFPLSTSVPRGHPCCSEKYFFLPKRLTYRITQVSLSYKSVGTVTILHNLNFVSFLLVCSFSQLAYLTNVRWVPIQVTLATLMTASSLDKIQNSLIIGQQM